MSDQAFETDDYLDLMGRRWFCVADAKKRQMVCNGYDGYFTCASFKTFAVWGWKRALPVVSVDVGGSGT